MNTLGLNFNLKHVYNVSFALPKRPLALIAVASIATFALQKLYNSFASDANQIEPGRVAYNTMRTGVVLAIGLVIFGKGMNAGRKFASSKNLDPVGHALRHHYYQRVKHWYRNS